MYRKSLAVLLSAGLILSVNGVYAKNIPTSQDNPSDTAFDNKIIKKIKADNMYDIVAKLSEQPRAAGTEGELIGVNFIKDEFEKYGYETELQPFTFLDVLVGTGTLEINGQAYDPYVFSGSYSAKVTAEVLHVGKALNGEVPDEVKGKIALIERGDIPFVWKLQNVLDKGAVGVIMYNHSGTSNRVGVANPGQDIPAVTITKDQGLALVDQLEAEPLTATIDVRDSGYVENTSHNVIATKKPHKNKDTGQIVVVGAHHDSVSGGPGANDDASGVSAVLEIARVMANMQTDTEIRFVTFGAEELGLLGSYHYVSTLEEEEIDNIVAQFQMDMVGSKDSGGDHEAGGLIMYTIDGERNTVTDLGAAAGARTSEVIPYGQLGRSDHQPFYEVGIPAALFIHAPVEDSYHTPADTIDKIDKNKLKQTADIVGASVYQIARFDTPALEHARVAPGPVDYEYDDRPVQ
ncbi:M20/M25/M40 family metallo-hydrolase [Bacillus spongiae]|uniref:M20/M25/M40 family metallo-hydrolase n=1 Tax=Bacillus spongiae TaxID=2683610 RepID=A0ABU8HDQ5_9BACI